MLIINIMKKKYLIIAIATIVLLAGFSAGAYVYLHNKKSDVYIAGKGDHPLADFTVLTAKDLPSDKFATYQAAVENLKTMPGDKGSLINLGYIFKDLKKYGDAEKAFTILATWDEIEPDPEANLGLARTYEDEGKYQDADLTYYKIIKTFPLYILAYKSILNLYDHNFRQPDGVFLTDVNHAREFDKKGDYKQDLENLIARFNEIKNRQK